MARKRVAAGKRVREPHFDFDVALSFAGEDRTYVSRVADAVREMGLKVFYDKYEQVSLWGKDLYTHLSDVYARRARYTVLFISKHYARKIWTNHERKSAQARAFQESSETILPARFDKTVLPGLLPTVGYVDLRGLDPRALAEMIREKIARFQRDSFFPKVPDRVVLAVLGRVDDPGAEQVRHAARYFFEQMQLMTEEERQVLGLLLYHGCGYGPPRNKHIDIELLCRLAGKDRPQVLALFERLGCLGIRATVKQHNTSHGKDAVRRRFDALEIQFRPLCDGLEGNWTGVMDAVAEVIGRDFCSEHFLLSWLRLDFSSLSTATRLPEKDAKTSEMEAEPAGAVPVPQARSRGRSSTGPRGTAQERDRRAS